MKKFLLGLMAMFVVGAPTALIAAPAQAASANTATVESFSVWAPPQGSGRLNVFYPTVRDRYRDLVYIDGYFTNQGGGLDWVVTFRNADGVTMAREFGDNSSYQFYGEWNTKNHNTGKPVPVGTYTATLVVTDSYTGEVTETKTRTLYAKSDTVKRRVTKSRTGADSSSRSRSNGCWIDREILGSGLTLDCWGGREAVATYGFRLPNNARNVTWNVRGERGCCDNGQVVKTGNRTGNYFNVRVRVTNWAAYTVDRASIAYTTTVRR